MEAVATEHNLKEALHKYFGFKSFKGQQEEVIDNLLQGKDTFVIMPTGGGKSMCYQLPALVSEGTAIVISPLIALMKNQVDMLRSFHKEDSIAHYSNSSLLKTEIEKVRSDVLSGKTKVLYLAPESLAKDDNVDFLKKVNISFLAIDEAHCISEWGHDFRPEYRKLRPMIEEVSPHSPVMALTATATPKVQSDIQKNLGMIDATVFKSSFNRANLYYEVRPKVEPMKAVIKYIKGHTGKSGIVYCLSRKKVEEVAETLSVNGINALPYHAGLDSAVRSETQDKFLMEDIDVIVATIAFGMGIDKPDIRFVIHFDIPKSLEGYYQETGRAGRDGLEGNCLAFYSYKDIQKLAKFMKGKPVAEQQIAQQLLLETVSYAESSVCRRKLLLHYFGEKYKPENCENCDNCRHPKKKFDGQEELSTVLEVIAEVKENFQAEHIVYIIMGVKSQEITTYSHDRLELYGCGNDRKDALWKSVIRQAMLGGFISKDIDSYGVLKMTAAGKKYLTDPYPIQLTEPMEHDFTSEDMEAGPATGGTSAVDPELFALLKDLRKEIAHKHNLPPYVIFNDPSLEDMATQYPTSVEELTTIAGVGQGKAKRYGKAFTEMIKKHVDENEIERPADFVVKSIVNKSGLKVSIIMNIDRKIPFDDIIRAKGISMAALLTEIDAIVSSGTKLNIDYYLQSIMDEDKLDEGYEYFRSTESDSIEEALLELGEDYYSKEELQMIHAKFMSELAH
ncbi:DNA helicase RecQ [bacterium AH-315-C07]|nr:DNA helicase RecQ [bacterium AH-315-C07]